MPFDADEVRFDIVADSVKNVIVMFLIPIKFWI